MINKIGGRKVFIGLILVAVAVGLEVFCAKGLTQTMANYLLYMGIGYFLANGAVKLTDAAKSLVAEKQAKEAPAPVDLAPVIAEVQKAATDTQAALKTLQESGGNSDKLILNLQGLANQNAVMTQILGEIASQTTYLVGVVQASTGQKKA